jgi:hypothetical protein
VIDAIDEISIPEGTIMRINSIRLAAAVALSASLLSTVVHAQAQPQTPPQGQTAGVSADVAVTTVRAKVTGINAKDRLLTVRGPSGNVFKLVAGPEVRNFAQIRTGDDIVLRYTQSVAYVISKPGTKLPDVAVGEAAARAPLGAKPAGAIGQRVTITGTIVGVDPLTHTLSVVDQHGGPVRTFAVTDPERQAALSSLKVGEMLSVVFTEAVAVAVEPAGRH